MPKLKDTRLSIVHPFYNDRQRLDTHKKAWATYPKWAQEAIDFVLVDDCSSKKELAVWTDFNRIKVPYFAIFRIMEDLKWNTPGALNLGVLKSTTDWVLFMDSDCLMLAEDVVKLLDYEPDPNLAYYFPRNRVCNDEKIRTAKADRCLPCAILIHKDHFIRVGGFDEDFTGLRAGGYGHFDNDLSDRIGRHNRRYLVGEGWGESAYEIGPRIVIQEYMPDHVGINVQTATSVTEKHILINKRLWYAKKRGETPRSRHHLRFIWKCRIDRRKIKGDYT